jgi:phospholipase C
VAPDGTVALRFNNTGKQGAVLHVYDRKHLDRIPRRYTVEAGKSLDDSAWNAAADGGAYDLDVYGPNGFVRMFKGNARANGAAALEMTVSYDAKSNTIKAQIRNAGAAPAAIKIAANAYRTDGPWNLTVAPNQSAEQSWIISDSGNWYDFTATATGFERRFAGRVENGGNLTSDPAMAT